MILMENAVQKDTITKVVNKIQDYMNKNVFKFDDTIDDINFWCDDDFEKTVFINSEDGGYATITKDYLEHPAETIDAIVYQLNGTEKQDDEDSE